MAATDGASSSKKRKFDQVSHCETRAAAKVYRVQQNWRIENFHLVHEQHQVGMLIHSDTFGEASGSGFTWRIGMYPHGRDEEHKDFVSVVLQSASAPRGIAKLSSISCKMAFVNSNGKILVAKTTKSNDYAISRSPCSRDFWKYVKTDETNCIVVICEVEFAEEKLNLQTKRSTAGPQFDGSASVEMFVSSIKALRQTAQLSDFTIVVVLSPNKSEKFAVHRAILAAQSPVFAAMFAGVWSELTNGSINLEGVSIEAVDAMLDFLYSGSCAWIPEYSMELLNLAEKYQIEHLKMLCESHLCSELTIENVCEMFRIVKMFNFSLKALAVECFRLFAKAEKEIVKTDEWVRLKKEQPAIALELFEFAARER